MHIFLLYNIKVITDKYENEERHCNMYMYSQTFVNDIL